MKKGLFIIAIVVSAIAAWMIAFPDKNPFKNLFKKANPNNSGASDPLIKVNAAFNTNPSVYPSRFNVPAPPTQDSYGFPLMKGSRGEYVTALQSGLNDNFGSDLEIDGIFGQKTYNTLSAHGFNADAISRTEYLKIING
nr:hypothetical protein [uncultured Draconibacterium sp.]